jgi:hypothetical protein
MRQHTSSTKTMKEELQNKNILTPLEAALFIEQNRYAVAPDTENNSRCVDGRYFAGMEILPPLAKPGADAGDFLTAFAALNRLGIYPEERRVYQAVMAVVGGEKNFAFHTDTHAEHDHKGSGRGCGHIAQADGDPTAYGVTKADMNFIFNTLKQLKQKGARETVLEGNHNEGAVIVIVGGDKYSIKPQGIDGKQVFVYHAALDEKRLEALTRALYEEFKLAEAKITYNQLLEAVKYCAQKQLNETVKRLALSKGLPIYNASFNEQGGFNLHK